MLEEGCFLFPDFSTSPHPPLATKLVSKAFHDEHWLVIFEPKLSESAALPELTIFSAAFSILAAIIAYWVGFRLAKAFYDVPYSDLIPSAILILGGIFGQSLIQVFFHLLTPYLGLPTTNVIVSASYTFLIVFSTSCLVTRVRLTLSKKDSGPGGGYQDD